MSLIVALLVLKFANGPEEYIVTGYCAGPCCCGPEAQGVTASGKRAVGRIAAADKSIPFGAVFVVPGYGRVAVFDRGGAIKGRRLDLLFRTHAQAKRWGVKRLKVTRVR